jgi:transposase
MDYSINSLVKKYFSIVRLAKKDKELNKYGRPNKISDKYCLKYMLIVLKRGVSWTSLEEYGITCHYTTIQKRFYLWRKKGFFERFHTNLLNNYKDYTDKHIPLSLEFIDSTDIINGNGLQKNTGYNIKFRNKRAVKIHAKNDINQIINSFTITPANIHDVTQVKQLVTNSIISLDATYRKPTYLGVDKAYISKDIKNELKKDHNIIYVYPRKINQPKKRIPKKKKEVLKKRCAIEHCFNKLKRCFKRIDILYDRDINNYKTFIEIANSIQIINYFNSKNINISKLYTK